MTTIIIVDDHQIFRESLSELLTKQDFKILGAAANGKEFLALLEKSVPDIVILDIAMPEMDGYEASKKALEKYPNLNILVLSSLGDEKYYYDMVHIGVKGFVLKKSGINELEEAINEIVAGGSWFSNELLRKIITKFNTKPVVEDTVKLTDRELEILNLICKGFTAEKIAEELCLSHETIHKYRTKLLSKTGCKNSPALVMYAIKNKLIEV